MKEVILGALGLAGVIILAIAAVYLPVVGIVKLITLCFDFAFSWKMATGVWLIMVLLRLVTWPFSREK